MPERKFDRCVGCAMGAHPHDTYTAKAPEVRSGEHQAGDDAGCGRIGCKCTWRRSRDKPRRDFVLEFDSRSDDGPRHVGPFPSREAAFAWAHKTIGGGEASYHAYPLTPPA